MSRILTLLAPEFVNEPLLSQESRRAYEILLKKFPSYNPLQVNNLRYSPKTFSKNLHEMD